MLDTKTAFITPNHMSRIVFLLFFVCVSYANAQYKQDSIKVEHGYLHFYTKGSGSAIVYLQGGPGFSNHYMRAISDSLNQNQNILIDYQGTGKSQYRKPDSTWVSIDNVVKDIELVRQKLKIEKWTVVGHSYGGMFALYYGVKYPKRVSKIITIANAGTNNRFQEHFGHNIFSRLGEQDRKLLNTLWDSPDQNATKENEIPGFGQADLILLKGYFYDPETNIPRLMSSIGSDYLPIVMNPDFFNAFVQNENFIALDITDQVIRLKVPIRMIESWQDPIYDGQQLLLNDKLKDSKIEFINQSGHFPWIEQPEKFFEVFKKLLKT
jgi:proline iminopeptidase